MWPLLVCSKFVPLHELTYSLVLLTPKYKQLLRHLRSLNRADCCICSECAPIFHAFQQILGNGQILEHVKFNGRAPSIYICTLLPRKALGIRMDIWTGNEYYKRLDQYTQHEKSLDFTATARITSTNNNYKSYYCSNSSDKDGALRI